MHCPFQTAKAQPCEVALRVSAEHISPNERKGYFLHHTPLTTTSVCSRHVLGEKTEPKRSSQQKNHFSLSPSFWIQSARVCPVLLAGSAVKPLALVLSHGQSRWEVSLHTSHKAANRRQPWWLHGIISKPILLTLFLQTRETIQLQLFLITVLFWAPSLTTSVHYEPLF